MVRLGLAADSQPLLVRERRVTKSSAAGASDRPLPKEHLDSMSCRPMLVARRKILVIDDVVTRGATLLACTSLLAERFPEAEVRAFALVRAMTNPSEFDGMLAPAIGSITLRPQGDTLRRP
jgi:predicted amidophosphoribosyltransferase